MIAWAEGREPSDEFYESLDRILSSSCSSTSDDDDDGDLFRRRHPYLPPPSAVSFDEWLCDPAPVEERRRRLLHHMGLVHDPTLARLELGGNVAEDARSREELGCSVSCERPISPFLAPNVILSPGSMSRSMSDGSVGSGKPPHVGRSKMEERGDVEVSFGDGGGGEDGRGCTIRDLDNGREFIVKEFKEDGMRNQLREVGTGRQFTLDEFEMCVGRSPIVRELMRRKSVEDRVNGSGYRPKDSACLSGGERCKRRSSWFRSFNSVVAGGHQRDRRSSDEKDSSSEKGGRRSSSATDDSQDTPSSLPHCPEWTKVRQYGKIQKELTGLYMSQEIQAHDGSIWTIKFSLDGRYLASAGEDCVIHVWKVLDHEKKWGLLMNGVGEENKIDIYDSVAAAETGNGDPGPMFELAGAKASDLEKKTRRKGPGGRKSPSLDNLVVPELVFALAERPVCSFRGHLGDVLDLSWSKSQHVLSSSMDKTVRLWHLSSNSCLKIFSHSDYVTCIQFNPVDDRYFISGSLDAKVRLWSIPDRQVLDWNDLREMVTAVSYRPDGQGALVGSHKGNCYIYDTSDNKLIQKSLLYLQNKRKKSIRKKVTGFQFTPGSSTEMLITSADSRIRIIDGSDLIHKFKGFRNTSSQISASWTANGEYVICASEDSQVYLWSHDVDSRLRGSNGAVTVTQAYESFHCLNVTAAVPWPSTVFSSGEISVSDGSHGSNLKLASKSDNRGTDQFGSRVSTYGKHNRHGSGDRCNDCPVMQSRSAYGMVIVTSTRGGEIRTYQNLGMPTHQ